MYKELTAINSRPEPFQFYSADRLWADEHTSKRMLAYHLNESIDVSSRKKSFIELSATWIASHFAIGEHTRVADFGCGPGLYATLLAEKGARVTGIDFSKTSLEYADKTAREKNLDIRYVKQNYLDYDTPDKFDLVMMIMCDFCALGPAQRKHMLQKFHAMLKPGGSVLLDVYSLNAFRQRQETATYGHNLLDGFWTPEDYYGFLNTFKYEQDKVVLDKYTIITASRTEVIYNWLQYFSLESLAQEFKANGFDIAEYYSDVAGTPFNNSADEFAVVARKR
jgi:2-polyprenyl-3-methyl-5-hydroxy-6-metoxy-1,4-benzoquinol methylase